ncbi:MAG TPA: sigma-70 family RNA polymerase sigma factor [Actinomycetota bacterium]
MSIEARYLEPEIPPELDQTYRRTFARLKGLFRARGCTPEEAADLAQEAAMRAYMHVQRWGVSGEGLDPLINRIARNLLIDRHRRVVPHLVSLDNAEDVGDPAADPPEEVFRRQRTREVRSAVSELPHRHQTALMYSLGGMTPAEVGDRLGIGRNAADALLHRARRSLRERLRHVGEGTFGVVFWFKIRAREAAARAGWGAPVEAAGAASVPATLAAAAALVAAINIVSPAFGGTSPPTGNIPVVAVAAVDAGSAGGSGISPSAATGGAGVNGEYTTTVTLPGGGSVGQGPGRLGADADVENPTDREQKVLGVGPDVIHQEDEASTAGTAFDSACGGRETTCNAIYRDPTGDEADR